ncbi:NfeD family protein [Bermanella sp. R86510]|uniref:NfeD family protein n=1 Tax=unclassified Bermanella TaxID=2627862 RepID=UPI0037C97F4B
MDILLDNIPRTLIIAGIAILIFEALALGFATFILTFLSASLVISGLLMYAEIVPQTWTSALWVNAILTPVIGFMLWKPLNKLQNKVDKGPLNSDFAEETFIVEQDVDAGGHATHKYSGIEWHLKSHQPIAKGTLVKVVRREVGTFWVEPVEQN